PRALLAVLSGSSLAVSGCILQSMLRNELATPYTLGVSAGAGLVAGLLVLTGTALPSWLIVMSGFGGALLAVSLVYSLSRLGTGTSDVRLLLAGITVNLIGAALLLLVEFFSPASRLVEIVRWMMGDLSTVGMTVPLAVLPFTVAGMLMAFARVGTLNQLAVGEDMARSRGVSVGRSRSFLLVSSALLAGSAVGAIGPVGFVGLIVPHFMRRVVGSDFRRLLPASALGGMILMLFADAGARVIVQPAELPIGIVMALLGGPFFLVLLLRRLG
ncbi:iron ABC transporter permease, partial [Candidatus Fermentibacterales bacterium]|nr:iron ABC transporter permease [Candidatus Fermentibacterales bacterium]